MPIDTVGHNSQLIYLDGDIGKFLHAVERKEYALVLRGVKGAGKTRFLYQLMNAFAKKHFKVAYFSLEIDRNSKLVKSMTDAYIQKGYQPKVYITSDAPNGMQDIRKAAKQFDVVAIDSFSKIKGVKQEDFDKLRKEFPNTFFLVIFQSTTGGTARGGLMSEYDAQAVIQIEKGGIAVAEKNRYSEGEDYKYSVFEEELIDKK
ncbi:hypothetical protein V6R21_24810 [Limibacter armeniacum]|uniref:hypothetical protein n=1 Tax=Limibacter armeniacum TaxID=466084 RepID=UPI002FE62E21